MTLFLQSHSNSVMISFLWDLVAKQAEVFHHMHIGLIDQSTKWNMLCFDRKTKSLESVTWDVFICKIVFFIVNFNIEVCVLLVSEIWSPYIVVCVLQCLTCLWRWFGHLCPFVVQGCYATLKLKTHFGRSSVLNID